MEPQLQPEKKSVLGILTQHKKRVSIFIVSLLLLHILFSVLFGSPFSFKKEKIIEIQHGMSLKAISEKLENEGVVSSKTFLSIMIKILRGESNVVSGTYSFKRKQGIFFVARRLIEGKTDIKAQKITFPEGITTALFTLKLQETFPLFDVNEFLELTKEKEGYLFPDTYFFLPQVTASEVAQKLENTFWEKTGEKFGFKKEEKEKIKDIVILASIVEEEVRGLEDKRIVAGIFLNRIKIGMPLQADSTLAYITGRDSLSLTVDDLKSKSPYNSYTNRGLPPTPISNPGLESIEAVLNPTKTKYLYFLTDKEGKVYYASTFEEHKLNKQKYLR